MTLQELFHGIILCLLAIAVAAILFGVTIEITVPTTSFIEGFN